ncbi:MAG: Nif3-like dinuclear metal center hexameric protein [Nitrososphaerales archaeon]
MNTEEIMKLALELADMKNVPADSAIHIPGKDIRKVLLCVDAEPAEIMLAKNLGCDAVIAHHPIGKASLNFHQVFDRHVDYMLAHGIPRDIAEEAVRMLKERVALRSHTSIYTHTVAVAERMSMPLLNIHLPCDELMRRTILAQLDASRIERVSDIKLAVEKIPEFKNAETKVQVAYGDLSNEVGRYALVVAAGTNGGYPVAKVYFDHGISTVIYLHVNGEDLAKLRADKAKGNLVILGHLAGDSVGLNQLSDALENKGVEVVKLGIVERN